MDIYELFQKNTNMNIFDVQDHKFVIFINIVEYSKNTLQALFNIALK